MTNFNQKFNIIKQRGDPNKAVLQTGEIVYRLDQIFVENYHVAGRTYTGFIPCIPYDNHFIYSTPINENYKGYPAHMCTCGGWGAIIIPDAYEHDMSRDGLKFGCYFRHIAFNADTGKFLHKHADGSS